MFGDASKEPAPVTEEVTILSATIMPDTPRIPTRNDCAPELESNDAKLAHARATKGCERDLPSAVEFWKASEAAGGIADGSLDISQATHLSTALVGLEADEVPEIATCWGAQLKGSCANCTPNFLPGKLHFKNKFCDTCKDGILIPVAQVRVVSNELAACFANKRSEGFWNIAPRSMGGGKYRILNNTAGSIGPRLALFRDQPPPFQWRAISRPNPHRSLA